MSEIHVKFRCYCLSYIYNFYRLAISLTINRKALVNNVLKNGTKAPTGIAPAEISKNPANGKDFTEESPDKQSTEFNPALAKKYWEKGLSQLGIKKLSLNMVCYDVDSFRNTAEYVQSSAQKYLKGLSIHINVEPKVQAITKMQSKKGYDLGFSNWIASFPDLSEFFQLLNTNNANNAGNYSNKQFDYYYNKANGKDSMSPQKRYNDFVKAEGIASEDQAVIDVNQGQTVRLNNPKLKGVAYAAAQGITMKKVYQMESIVTVNQTDIYNDWNYLHEHGETAFKEVNTTKYLAKRLREMGAPFELFDNMTGMIVTLGSGSPMIGIRSDIDALKQTYNGKMGIFHSCGHDAHMSVVLALAQYFVNNPEELKGTLKVIFQPAEETVTGAEKVIKSGKLPHLDVLYGLHVTPESEVKAKEAQPMLKAAATRTLWLTIRGKAAHAGTPQLGANVIDAFTELNEKLRSIKLKTDLPYSVTTTMVHAGESSNIVPDYGTFAIDFRTRTNELMDILQQKIFDAIDNVQKREIKIAVDGNDLSPASIPSEKANSVMRNAIERVLGKEGVVPPKPNQGGDDFHFYAYDGLASESTMLGLGCNLKPGLHIPGMTFEKSSMIDGAKIMIEAVKSTQQEFN